jgi:quinol monooxygenase YgiN
VPDDAKEEFLKVMDIDMQGSRAEEGCLRFDLLHAGGGVYHFYEVHAPAMQRRARPTTPDAGQPRPTSLPQVYESDEAAAHHKTLSHYTAWAEFKAKHMGTIGATQTVQKFTLVGEP